MQNQLKKFEGILLRFVGVATQASAKTFSNKVMIGNSPNRGLNRAIGLEMGHVVKGAVKPNQDVGGGIVSR